MPIGIITKLISRYYLLSQFHYKKRALIFALHMAADNADVMEGTIVPKEPPGRRHRVITWLRRIGLAGFAFFLFKGLAWLFFGAALVKYFGCNQ